MVSKSRSNLLMVDRIKAVNLMQQYLDLIGLPHNVETDRTAERVVDMHMEEWHRLHDAEPEFSCTVFPNVRGVDQLVVERDITFSSWCAHHLCPFIGTAHIGYLPNKYIVGLSKMARAVDYLAAHPTTQEVLGEDIADFLLEKLQPTALFISLEAVHTCISCRGVRKPDARTITNVVRGESLPTLKQEFFDILARR